MPQGFVNAQRLRLALRKNEQASHEAHGKIADPTA
jgi:hypothetical protein